MRNEIPDQRLLGAIDAKVEALIREITSMRSETSASITKVADALAGHIQDDQKSFSNTYSKIEGMAKWIYMGLGIAILLGVLIPVYLK